MPRPSTRIRLFGAAGFLVSAYALHVERGIENEGPDYQPLCVTTWGSCVSVFSSSYAHILSHWGLVARGSALDFSLASMGLLNYGAYMVRCFGMTDIVRYLKIEK